MSGIHGFQEKWQLKVLHPISQQELWLLPEFPSILKREIPKSLHEGLHKFEEFEIYASGILGLSGNVSMGSYKPVLTLGCLCLPSPSLSPRRHDQESLSL